MKIFSVYDDKADAYTQPFFAPTSGVAIRQFAQAANDEGHEFSKHAADYTLFEIGEFDPQTGAIYAIDSGALKPHGNALQYKESLELNQNLHPLERN